MWIHSQNHTFSIHVHSIDTMLIWGNTDVLRQNDRGKLSDSRCNHCSISINLHYAGDLYRPTTVDNLQNLYRERWIKIILYISLAKNVTMRSVMDRGELYLPLPRTYVRWAPGSTMHFFMTLYVVKPI